MNTDFEYEKKAYFAAANSKSGFTSFFDEIFDSETLDRLYVIKGGSGTGKSRFMRDIAGAFEKEDRNVEYFYCSSDPYSLDGIILIDRRIGIIDGTSPHTTDLRLPGCFDDIINLGEFWNGARLREHRKEIESICTEKSELLKKAYLCLAAAGDIDEVHMRTLAPLVKTEKLQNFANRVAARFPKSQDPRKRIRLTEALCSLGRVRLESFGRLAEERYVLHDPTGISRYVLSAITSALDERGVSYTVALDPLNTSFPTAVYIDGSKTSFTTERTGDDQIDDIVINTDRFFDRAAYKSERAAVRTLVGCESVAIKEYTQYMCRIREKHELLEGIYGDAMDFDAKEDFTAAFIKKLS